MILTFIFDGPANGSSVKVGGVFARGTFISCFTSGKKCGSFFNSGLLLSRL